jgi:hypothetical protein
MYQHLGSKWLSKLVKESFTPRGELITNESATKLEEVIHERTPILMYDGHQLRNDSDLKPNAVKILGEIKVYEVNQIEIVRTFGDQQKTQQTTAFSGYLKNAPVLLVTKEFDYFDIASVLSKMILKSPRLNDSLLISTFLSTSLVNLTSKGFPVERILNLHPKMNHQQPKPIYNPPLIKEDSETMNSKTESLFDSQQRIDSQGSQKQLGTSVEKRDPFEKMFGVMTEFGKSLLGSRDGKDKTPNDYSGSYPGSYPGNFPGNSPLSSNEPQRARNPAVDVESNQQLRELLKSSVNSVKTQSSSNEIPINFPKNDRIPPSIHSQCSTIDPQNLILIKTLNLIPIFSDKRYLEEAQTTILTHENGVERFTLVLKFLAQVFDLKTGIHIYFDNDCSTIAFNRNHSLFFNVRFYLALHLPIGDGEERSQTYYYWFMVFCHELAHNHHDVHNEVHEYYMSSFAKNYLDSLINTLKAYGIK